MGIEGLLSLVKPARRSIHVREYQGKTVAIDAMRWYRFGSEELCLGRNTDKYLGVTRKMISMLQANGITPIFVIDGNDLPAKEGENADRKKSE